MPSWWSTHCASRRRLPKRRERRRDTGLPDGGERVTRGDPKANHLDLTNTRDHCALLRYNTHLCNYTSVMNNDQLTLEVSTSSLGAMSQFEQLLLSNSGVDAFDLAVKLLAAKLLDEQTNKSQPLFRIHGTPEETHLQIAQLYANALKTWPNLDDGGAQTLDDISPQQLVRSIRPLLGWRLTDSNLAQLDAALERLVSRASKGALGQYFTPREVVRLCVDALSPRTDELVMDPACGSGGFLFEAVELSRRRGESPPKCLGIDLSAKSSKVATLLAAATPNPVISISKANSLDGRAYAEKTPPEWTPFICQVAASHTPRAASWGSWNRLGCDVLLTNPPFAGDIDEFEMLEAYEAQQEQSNRKVVSREHLFLERAIDLLRPGGRLAIVVPQGILANGTAAYLRTWLLRKCRVLAVIGLHPYAFLPFTGVKTAILFLQKPAQGEAIPAEYPIFFSASQDAGKDSSGRAIGRGDYQALGQSLNSFFSENGFEWAGEIDGESETVETEIVMLSEVLASGRLDAEHYDPAARHIEKSLSKASSAKVGDMVENKVPKFRRKDFEQISYVDISSVDARTGLSFPQTIDAADAPSRASYLVQPGDVLVSTVRPDRNVVAFVTADQDEGPATVASNGFCVLRAKDVSPELLFAYCKTDAFRKVLTMHAAASMYPTVSERDVLSVPFLHPGQDLEKTVVDLIRSGLEMIGKAQRQIQQAVELLNGEVEKTRRAE